MEHQSVRYARMGKRKSTTAELSTVEASRFLSTEQVAALLGICAKHVTKMCRQGKIRATKVGTGRHSVWLILPEDAERARTTPRSMGRPAGWRKSASTGSESSNAS